jgi:hypothetical protein
VGIDVNLVGIDVNLVCIDVNLVCIDVDVDANVDVDVDFVDVVADDPTSLSILRNIVSSAIDMLLSASI